MILGSFLLASARSSDQVIQRLKSDVFFRHGVWELGQVANIPGETA